VLGRIASYYYLAHQTVHHFRESLQPDMTTAQVIQVRILPTCVKLSYFSYLL
jgi:hypothetical protein